MLSNPSCMHVSAYHRCVHVHCTCNTMYSSSFLQRYISKLLHQLVLAYTRNSLSSDVIHYQFHFQNFLVTFSICVALYGLILKRVVQPVLWCFFSFPFTLLCSKDAQMAYLFSLDSSFFFLTD